MRGCGHLWGDGTSGPAGSLSTVSPRGQQTPGGWQAALGMDSAMVGPVGVGTPGDARSPTPLMGATTLGDTNRSHQRQSPSGEGPHREPPPSTHHAQGSAVGAVRPTGLGGPAPTGCGVNPRATKGDAAVCGPVRVCWVFWWLRGGARAEIPVWGCTNAVHRGAPQGTQRCSVPHPQGVGPRGG